MSTEGGAETSEFDEDYKGHTPGTADAEVGVPLELLPALSLLADHFGLGGGPCELWALIGQAVHDERQRRQLLRNFRISQAMQGNRNGSSNRRRRPA